MRLEDALATLAAMPEALRLRLAGLTDAQLRFKPGTDTFSVLENVWHLRDIEVEGYAHRLTLLLREENPLLPDLDGSALARERRYNSQPLQPSLDAFVASRRASLAILADVTPAQLERRGLFENVGEVSLSRLLELWVEHDHGHLKELDDLLPILREPLAGHKPKPSQSLLSS
jgi:hypothetical protein